MKRENLKNLILVIFGASGDLTSRKLIPAIFSLKDQNLLPEKFAVIGVGRSGFSNEEFRKKMKESIISFCKDNNPDEKQIKEFTGCLTYLSMDASIAGNYGKLKSILAETDR